VLFRSLIDISFDLDAGDGGAVTYWPAYSLWKGFHGVFMMTLGVTSYKPYNIGHAIYLFRAYCFGMTQLFPEFERDIDQSKGMAALAVGEIGLHKLDPVLFAEYIVHIQKFVESLLQTLYATYPTFVLDLMKSYPARLVMNKEMYLIKDRDSPVWDYLSSGTSDPLRRTTRPSSWPARNFFCEVLMKLRSGGAIHGLQTSGLMRWTVDYVPNRKIDPPIKPIRCIIEGLGQTVYDDEWLTAHGYQAVNNRFPDFRPLVSPPWAFPSSRTYHAYHKRMKGLFQAWKQEFKNIPAPAPAVPRQVASASPMTQKRQISQGEESASVGAPKVGRSESITSSKKRRNRANKPSGDQPKKQADLTGS
jgi:hypothetical protein